MALSTRGIAAQIASSVGTYNCTDHCTENDCIVAVTRLIHAYGEATGERRNPKFVSKEANRPGTETQIEHVIPVKVIVKALMRMRWLTVSSKSVREVEAYLRSEVILAKVTKSQHDILLKDVMPAAYYDNGSPLFRDQWARYKVTGLFESIDAVL